MNNKYAMKEKNVHYRKIIMLAAEKTGLDQYYDFSKDSIVTDGEEITFLNGYLNLNKNSADKYVLNSKEPIGTTVHYITNKQETLLEVIEAFEKFIEEVALRFSCDSHIFTVDDTLNEAATFKLELEIVKELKKNYPRSIYNPSKSIIYIPEYRSVPIRMQIFYEFNLTYKVEIRRKEILVRADYRRIKEEFEEGSLILRIDSLLLQSLYEDMDEGAIRHIYVNTSLFSESFLNRIGNADEFKETKYLLERKFKEKLNVGAEEVLTKVCELYDLKNRFHYYKFEENFFFVSLLHKRVFWSNSEDRILGYIRFLKK